VINLNKKNTNEKSATYCKAWLFRKLDLLNLCLFHLFYFQKRKCIHSISNEFQFKEFQIRAGNVSYFVYQNMNNKSLGINPGCNDTTLHLINATKRDRRCYFERL